MLSEAESALSFLVETHPRAESALSFLIEKYHILGPLSAFYSKNTQFQTKQRKKVSFFFLFFQKKSEHTTQIS